MNLYLFSTKSIKCQENINALLKMPLFYFHIFPNSWQLSKSYLNRRKDVFFFSSLWQTAVVPVFIQTKKNHHQCHLFSNFWWMAPLLFVLNYTWRDWLSGCGIQTVTCFFKWINKAGNLHSGGKVQSWVINSIIKFTLYVIWHIVWLKRKSTPVCFNVLLHYLRWWITRLRRCRIGAAVL